MALLVMVWYGVQRFRAVRWLPSQFQHNTLLSSIGLGSLCILVCKECWCVCVLRFLCLLRCLFFVIAHVLYVWYLSMSSFFSRLAVPLLVCLFVSLAAGLLFCMPVSGLWCLHWVHSASSAARCADPSRADLGRLLGWPSVRRWSSTGAINEATPQPKWCSCCSQGVKTFWVQHGRERICQEEKIYVNSWFSYFSE